MAGSSTGSPGGESDPTGSRWEFLARATRELVDSLDHEATLETVAGLSLPQLGSWSIVDLTEPDGSVRRLAIVHPDARCQVIARRLKEGWPPRRDDPLGVSAVARTGRAEIIPHGDDTLLARVAGSEENLAHLRELGIVSVMTVPLSARGKVLGAITFVASEPGGAFTDDDLALAEDLAHRCAIAIDNARLYQSARQVAALGARPPLDAAHEAKQEFLGTVSHELRTPLNIMASYLELLAMEIAGPLTERQREYVTRVQRSEQQLLRIVEDMLNFIRLHEGAIDYQMTRIPLRPVVRDAVDAYRPALHAKDLEVDLRCEDDVSAEADPPKVWQILANILSNARKFTDPGGKVTVECEQRREGPVIRVRDTGCGIPPEKAEAVFEPFVQGDPALTRRGNGLGLGLSISRQLARAMGGDLVVESLPGAGCTFILTLKSAS
jgi:signal transduction histidine kinase